MMRNCSAWTWGSYLGLKQLVWRSNGVATIANFKRASKLQSRKKMVVDEIIAKEDRKHR